VTGTQEPTQKDTDKEPNMAKHRVTLIPGDGIGPECVAATVEIINATGVDIEWIERHAGERVFAQGIA
jgi:isocitrate dehydrogenase